MITRYRRESRASNIVLAAVVVVLALVTFSTPGSGLAAEQTLRATSSYALSEDFRYVRDGKALLELIPIRSATAPTTAASAATANTPADAAAVRSILTNPPALEYYEYEVLPDARFLHQRASRGDITTGLHVYRGRSRDAEANWTQFRPKESLDLDTEPSLFVGRFKGITWHAAGDYLTVLGEETALRTHAYGCARMLTRLGLPGVDFEHATWDGASFNSTEHFCASTPFEWSMRVTGQIRQLAPGRFEIVITDAATGTITARVLLNYAPDSNNTQFPRTIEIARNFDSHEDTCLVLVSEARVASTVLPDELFDPRKMSEVGRRIEIKQRPMP